MSRRAEYLIRQSRDASTFDGTYQTLGDALSDSVVLIKCINNSDKDVDISIDGTTDHDFIPAGSFFLYDVRTNHGVNNDLRFPLGTQFYTKSTAGTGDIYLICVIERGQR